MKNPPQSASQDFTPDQLLRYMPHVQQQRQELRLVEAAWNSLTLLSSLSILSAKASAGNDLGQARKDFAALSNEMMRGLASEALSNVIEDLGTRAQMCIDIVVRNLFERSADIGFFATDAVIAGYLANPQESERLAVERHLYAYASKYTVYHNIFLFDAQLQCRAALRRTDHESAVTGAQDLAFLQKVLATPSTYTQDLAIHGFGSLNQATLVYAQAVLDGTQACGVLCLEFNLADEASTLFNSIVGENDSSAVLALIDPQGKVIKSSDVLQLPEGWLIAKATHAGTFALQHMGRRYMAVARETAGFQGYVGLGWRGLALIPLDMAFEDQAQTDEGPLMQEATSNADLLPGALRQIPVRSAAIQSALERSVWNGLLELNHAQPQDIEAQSTDVLFAKTLLSEIGVTAQKTASAFSAALHDLHKVVVVSTLRDTQNRAALAMQILDRNLYERANDCRWWALTTRFATTLSQGIEHCAESTQTLKKINALYTVYSCLVLFDQQGKVLAVSNDNYSNQVGQTLDEPWVQATLKLGSSQDYTVSDFVASRFYPNDPTYIYAAAVRAFGADTGAVLGGIAIVWDATPQMKSILSDCAAGLPPEDGLMFMDAKQAVLHSHGKLPTATAALQKQMRAAEPIVQIQEHLYALGRADAPCYREFGIAGGYQHGLYCLTLRHLCVRQANSPPTGALEASHQRSKGRITQAMQLLTFCQGTFWLGLDSSLIFMAAPDANVLAATSTKLPFLGIAQIQNKVYPVIDMRSVMSNQAIASPKADTSRQLILLRIPIDNKVVEFALRVDRLGAMLDLDRSQLQALNILGKEGTPSMIDAVVRFDSATQQPPGVLYQLSKTWLQYCVRNLEGGFSAQNLDEFRPSA